MVMLSLVNSNCILTCVFVHNTALNEQKAALKRLATVGIVQETEEFNFDVLQLICCDCSKKKCCIATQ